MPTPEYVLHVAANVKDYPRWFTYVVTDDPPTIQMTAPVDSFAEAEVRANRHGYKLRVESVALDQMTRRSVGPVATEHADG